MYMYIKRDSQNQYVHFKLSYLSVLANDKIYFLLEIALLRLTRPQNKPIINISPVKVNKTTIRYFLEGDLATCPYNCCKFSG